MENALYAGAEAGLSKRTCLALARVAARQAGPARHAMPVGLIGPREATAEQLGAARILGYALARSGMPLLCGGKGGVMEAAARGCHEAGGIVIGLLPEDDATAANAFLTVALPTGLGITRNALIARASLCLIAVGGGLGTLSEIALGLQWGKRVFTMLDAPLVNGAERFDDIDALATSVAEWLASEALMTSSRMHLSAL
ncbi:TIGR00725 family protein [Ralstonia solanacearum]|uniref:TIGR00725 family protein n=2 Tax=Ralstonia solanacearum species complex TaxID=3116862 RepID=A0AAD0S7V6_RALSL|nr:TIGR00725 family protein [Ralstonia solanacearum]CBJ50957.1 exported protein of unknown function, putative lysine decarboxylase domain [Ralstonia solanacearum PSI07]AXV86201.1 TIGR00725 family protein [Ralstonia solanacearum]AXW05706.1 TIGR00725 family protein [Ralstonia solanacearum]AXW23447.1 TIGR00725 family protein [Ralstonia solanacearum]